MSGEQWKRCTAKASAIYSPGGGGGGDASTEHTQVRETEVPTGKPTARLRVAPPPPKPLPLSLPRPVGLRGIQLLPYLTRAFLLRMCFSCGAPAPVAAPFPGAVLLHSCPLPLPLSTTIPPRHLLEMQCNAMYGCCSLLLQPYLRR